MMNNNSKNRYIFITPYLDEVERIKTSCAVKKFVSPERNNENGYSKLKDVHSLLRAGKNIASTHALFSTYTKETQELIRANKYILVLDEVIDLFQPADIDGGDIELLIRNNITTKQNDNIIWADDVYDGKVFNELMQISKSNNLIDYDGSFFFWSIPIEVFNCFESAYILTYMFDYQMLKYFFDANDVKYELIGTKKTNGVFQFCNISEMDRRINLRDKIHINYNEKYNEIGNTPFSLSLGWFERSHKENKQPKLTILKNNLYNIFRHSKSRNDDKMWSTFNKYKSYLRGKGYTNGFITFNKRATNSFANRHHLAYCVNVFLQPWVKNYLMKIGAKEVNQDMYALSILIQWIFRSAIRNGEDIFIYLPSKRMRFLLEKWIDNLYHGNDLKEIKFNSKKVRRVKEALHSVIKVKKQRRD